MLEKPLIADERIIEALQHSYGVEVAELKFLPLGYDVYAGVYRMVATDGQIYFLKARSNAVDEMSVSIPRYLKTQGITEVVAPLPTIIPESWAEVDGYALLLYPFIDGESRWGNILSDAQWLAFGDVLHRIHDTHLPPDLLRLLRKETFVPQPKLTSNVKRMQATISTATYDNPYEQQLATFWKEHTGLIGEIVTRTEQLGRMLQGRTLDFVLCHSDIHTANLMLEPTGAIHVVDWDQPMIAPKERDLLYLLDQTMDAKQFSERESLFLRGYGDTVVDPLALAYYRYEWVVQDMGANADEVFWLEGIGDETKQSSAELFMLMFDSGERVEAAITLDRTLGI